MFFYQLAVKIAQFLADRVLIGELQAGDLMCNSGLRVALNFKSVACNLLFYKWLYQQADGG